MNALAVTAVTNFILACEVFLIAGLLLGRPKALTSAAGVWALALACLGASALLGGIDHGFVEPFGQTPNRILLERTNWGVLGLTTFGVFMTTARQFFAPGAQRLLFGLAGLQLAVYLVLVAFVGNFLVVIVNYAPVMLFLLVMSVLGLRAGRGSWPMVAGIVLLFIASGVQASGFDALSPVDHNGLYHLIAMAAVVGLYFGGLRLKTD